MKDKQTKAQQIDSLSRRIIDLEAQLLSSLGMAHRNIPKAGDALMASACVISIHAPGGRVICSPFAISDGLSKETIAAIQADIRRSIDLSVSFNKFSV